MQPPCIGQKLNVVKFLINNSTVIANEKTQPGFFVKKWKKVWSNAWDNIELNICIIEKKYLILNYLIRIGGTDSKVYAINHLKLTLNLKSSSAHPSVQSSCCRIHSEKLFQKVSNNEKDFIIFNLSKGRLIPFSKKESRWCLQLSTILQEKATWTWTRPSVLSSR